MKVIPWYFFWIPRLIFINFNSYPPTSVPFPGYKGKTMKEKNGIQQCLVTWLQNCNEISVMLVGQWWESWKQASNSQVFVSGYVHTSTVPLETRKVIRSPRAGITDCVSWHLWMLGPELPSSARAVLIVNFWAIIYYCYCCVCVCIVYARSGVHTTAHMRTSEDKFVELALYSHCQANSKDPTQVTKIVTQILSLTEPATWLAHPDTFKVVIH